MLFDKGTPPTESGTYIDQGGNTYTLHDSGEWVSLMGGTPFGVYAEYLLGPFPMEPDEFLRLGCEIAFAEMYTAFRSHWKNESTERYTKAMLAYDRGELSLELLREMHSVASQIRK